MKKAKKAEPKEPCLNFVIEPSCQTNGADRMNVSLPAIMDVAAQCR